MSGQLCVFKVFVDSANRQKEAMMPRTHPERGSKSPSNRYEVAALADDRVNRAQDLSARVMRSTLSILGQ
jgi:hypothetical protein